MENVTVIGAGTMGNGIAHLFAMKGHQVYLVDVSKEVLENAIATITQNLDRMVKKETISKENKELTLKNITVYQDLKTAVKNTDLVIEAASESIHVKLAIFKQLNEMAPEHAILASNTSSISITKIAAATSRPGQVIGMHFMNPVPVMKLVEVIKGYSTTEKVTNSIIGISEKLGKTPVVVNDYPGFVANRILMPMINEAIFTLFEGEAGVKEIDTVMKLGMAHPMGPLQLADFIGLDVCLAILKVLQEGFGNPKYAPCPLLTNMVTAGKLGVKSGEGFYLYKPGVKELEISPVFMGISKRTTL